MWPTLLSVLMLVCSNLIMTYAWFGHLKDHPDTFWFKVVLFSWSLAFFEYTLMIPAVRMASKHITVTQLKIVQEAISLPCSSRFQYFSSRKALRLTTSGHASAFSAQSSSFSARKSQADLNAL